MSFSGGCEEWKATEAGKPRGKVPWRKEGEGRGGKKGMIRERSEEGGKVTLLEGADYVESYRPQGSSSRVSLLPSSIQKSWADLASLCRSKLRQLHLNREVKRS